MHHKLIDLIPSYTNPREIMSGPESNLFVLKSILTTTITKPSSDNSLRSLITTLPISPIPLPSTSTLPDGMRPALRAESC